MFWMAELLQTGWSPCLLLTCRLALMQVVFRGFILRNGYDTSYMCLARRAAKSNNIWNRLVRRGSTLRRISMYGRSPSDGAINMRSWQVTVCCSSPLTHHADATSEQASADALSDARVDKPELKPGSAAALARGNHAGPGCAVPHPHHALAGLLQLVFTVVVLVLFVPVFHSFWLGLLWQVCPWRILLPWQEGWQSTAAPAADPLKLRWCVHACHLGPPADDTSAMRRAFSLDVQVIKAVAPVWYGARWQCEKVPKHAVLKVLKQQAAVAHCQEPTVQSKALDLKQQPKQLPAERALA